MQREVILTGIGGQGIQLAAKTLAMAATAEGRQVMMSSHYGGEMRGGQTEASVVVSDGDLRAVPILESAWSALVMHGRYWPGVASRLRDGGVVVVNTSVAPDVAAGPASSGRSGYVVVGVPAGDLAAGIGASQAAGFVLLGAYGSATGIVGTDSLVQSMRDLVPPYRTQHIAANEAAIRAGAGAVDRSRPAWDEVAA